jgi:hypothetical protein
MLKAWFAGILIAGVCAAAAPAPDCKLVAAWAQRGAVRSYEADNLFEYMDGNAEGYLLYGFQTMKGVTCTKGGISVVIDVSDFGDADSAYGFFSSNRDLRVASAKIGAGGQIIPRRAIFVKDRYYVEVAVNQEGDHTAALTEWSAAWEKLVPGSSTPPVALSWFPAGKQQSMRLIPESVMGIRALKRGYAGIYDYGKAFVVIEESPETASAALQKVKARFVDTTPAKVGDESFQVTDKYLGRLCFFRKGRYLAGWANVADGQSPETLSTELSQKLP